MITSTVSEGPWSSADATGREPGISVEAKSDSRKGPRRHLLRLLDDAVSLLLVALLFPVVILLIGAPIALLVRLILEIAQRV